MNTYQAQASIPGPNPPSEPSPDAPSDPTRPDSPASPSPGGSSPQLPVEEFPPRPA